MAFGDDDDMAPGMREMAKTIKTVAAKDAAEKEKLSDKQFIFDVTKQKMAEGMGEVDAVKKAFEVLAEDRKSVV